MRVPPLKRGLYIDKLLQRGVRLIQIDTAEGGSNEQKTISSLNIYPYHLVLLTVLVAVQAQNNEEVPNIGIGKVIFISRDGAMLHNIRVGKEFNIIAIIESLDEIRNWSSEKKTQLWIFSYRIKRNGGQKWTICFAFLCLSQPLRQKTEA